MGARHSGREAALQMLFQMEASGLGADEVTQLYWRSFGADAEPESRAYADQCVLGVAASLPSLDRHIGAASQHWRVERMTRVDRNVLRLGTWELAERTDVPRAVVLDEAVELAKSFGNDDSSAFVNGVLNRVADAVGRIDEPRTTVSAADGRTGSPGGTGGASG
jgi:N utilization substance protein B